MDLERGLELGSSRLHEDSLTCSAAAGLPMASGVDGETTVSSERSVGEAVLGLPFLKFLNSEGTCMTDCGSSLSAGERILSGS